MATQYGKLHVESATLYALLAAELQQNLTSFLPLENNHLVQVPVIKLFLYNTQAYWIYGEMVYFTQKKPL